MIYRHNSRLDKQHSTLAGADKDPVRGWPLRNLQPRCRRLNVAPNPSAEIGVLDQP